MPAEPAPAHSARARPRVLRVERDAILSLREAVLSGPKAPVRTLSGDLAPTTRHWAAVLDGAVVGCVSVMALRGMALRGMAVSSQCRGQGIGAALMQTVLAQVAGPMWCNARAGAIGFYARMGWIGVGPRFRLGGQPHQRMTWAGPP